MVWKWKILAIRAKGLALGEIPLRFTFDHSDDKIAFIIIF